MVKKGSLCSCLRRTSTTSGITAVCTGRMQSKSELPPSPICSHGPMPGTWASSSCSYMQNGIEKSQDQSALQCQKLLGGNAWKANYASQKHRWCRIPGHLKVCSNALYFVPRAIQEPIYRIPYRRTLHIDRSGHAFHLLLMIWRHASLTV